MAVTEELEVVYIGDPMCSWCWGISSELIKLRDYCEQNNLVFRVVAGGLRPGGGDQWTPEFTGFLRKHWQHVADLTGRDFKYDILDWDSFDYDTEPACRSVVVARSMLTGSVLDFFVAVQRKYYLDNEDPKESGFYESICADFDLDYETFVQRFESTEMREKVQQDFQLSRSLGVTGFPSILLLKDATPIPVSSGYAAFPELQARLDALIQAQTPNLN